ncbi:HTH-type transcriptional regulator GltC [Nonomuraea coxensis DSM 45129]|uniref:HTH-type transcriptional regulator GltC n=1 Tax=Nonomuraea coxensis DSM 45129 TaxID=1122611 RepID=A0ABX8UCN6_9ACTN|nr:LysR family transcriptional regulator [Nonomuraea coxensis]QYC45513.1 HTH-type transcriptional regulator GltC [Nonomuraea coxensis DSM 45129]
MELRDIEIFLTLAEELHFGRTAERLHVTPSRVSQAIKKQERRIGAALFDRDSRNVRLTPIGRRLFEDLQPMYRGLCEGIDRATRAARGKRQVLRIGMINANHQDLRPLLDAFEARHPTCDLNIRHVGFNDPFGPLRAGAVDVQIAWLPVQEADLTVGPVVYIEPVVLAVGVSHRLAARASISYEDLADEVVMGGARPDYWREALVPRRTPNGRPIPAGPVVDNSAEMLPLLSNGEAVSPVHAHAARYFPRPDIAYVPIHDAPPARWALIWRTTPQSDLIQDLARTAHRIGPITSPELEDHAPHP